MDTHRQLQESHALRRLYNSHPAAANRSLIKSNEYENFLVVSLPLQGQQSHAKRTGSTTRPNSRRETSSPTDRPTTTNRTGKRYSEARQGSSWSTRQEDVAQNEATLIKFRRKLNESKKQWRNQQMTMSEIRAGMMSAPLLATDDSDSFVPTSSRYQFLKYQHPPSRVHCSMLVSKMRIQERQECHDNKSMPVDANNNVMTDNIGNGSQGQLIGTRSLASYGTSGRHASCDNVSLPEIAKSHTDAYNAPSVFMFGRWGYRNRSSKKGKVPDCWMNSWMKGNSENLSIKPANVSYQTASRSCSTAGRSRSTPKTTDPIEMLRAQSGRKDNNKVLPAASVLGSDVADQETASPVISRQSSFSSSSKSSTKLKIVINPPIKDALDDDELNVEVSNLADEYDERSLSPVC